MAKDGKERLYTQADVDRMIAPLLAKIAELEAKIAQLSRDSRTSSKPPSSDVIKPNSGANSGGDAGDKSKKRKRKRGGQKGHPKHQRALFSPDQIDRTFKHELDDTAGLEPLKGDEEWRIVQQIEMLDKPYRIIEHRARRYKNIATGRIVTAPLPKEFRRGILFGPRFTGWIAYLKGPGHLSYRSIQAFFDEVMGLKFSVGVIVNAIGKVTAALAKPHEQLRAALPRQPVLGVDETGHRHRGKQHWTWCFQAPGPEGLTCFVIDASRGSSVVKKTLGQDYAGVIVCDYFSAYRKCLADMPGLTVQFCWAHLVRDLKFLSEHSDKVVMRYGLKVLAPVRQMFKLLARRAELTDAGYRRSLAKMRDAILKAIRSVPKRAETRKIAKRFGKHAAEYFVFMDRDDVEPTNNRTEQKIRFVVIDRKITQGTKDEMGWQWSERIWSAIATCRQRGKSVYRFLCEAIQAQLDNQPAPSLLEG